MKLLVDENLPDTLAQMLRRRFPGTVHVGDVDLRSAPDPFVWEYARENGFDIITQDADFRARIHLYGAPPKVVWVRMFGADTAVMLSFIALRLDRIDSFLSDPEESFLELP